MQAIIAFSCTDFSLLDSNMISTCKLHWLSINKQHNAALMQAVIAFSCNLTWLNHAIYTDLASTSSTMQHSCRQSLPSHAGLPGHLQWLNMNKPQNAIIMQAIIAFSCTDNSQLSSYTTMWYRIHCKCNMHMMSCECYAYTRLLCNALLLKRKFTTPNYMMQLSVDISLQCLLTSNIRNASCKSITLQAVIACSCTACLQLHRDTHEV